MRGGLRSRMVERANELARGAHGSPVRAARDAAKQAEDDARMIDELVEAARDCLAFAPGAVRARLRAVLVEMGEARPWNG